MHSFETLALAQESMIVSDIHACAALPSQAADDGSDITIRRVIRQNGSSIFYANGMSCDAFDVILFTIFLSIVLSCFRCGLPFCMSAITVTWCLPSITFPSLCLLVAAAVFDAHFVCSLGTCWFGRATSRPEGCEGAYGAASHPRC